MQRGPRSEALRGVPNPSAPAKAPADLGGSFLFPSPVLPPSDEGGGKPEGLDGGRDRPGLLRSGMRRASTSCLPCVRGGAERMRSGGVVGTVQEKVAWYRKPAPTRHLQPLSQGLSALPAPLFDRGRFCGNAGRHRAAGRARSDGRNHVPPVNPPLFGRGATCPPKKPPCLLDKAALGCYSGVSKNGCQC